MASEFIPSLDAYIFEIDSPAANAPSSSQAGEKRAAAESTQDTNITNDENGLDTEPVGPAPVHDPEPAAAGRTEDHEDDQGFPSDTAVHRERFDKEEVVQ
jgi:hypothetical protein